jgi:hypothetical protein
VISTGGNLGLGVTPSAWGLGKAFEVGNAGNALWSVSSGDVRMMANAYYNGTNYIYSTTAAASYYRQSSSTHQWYTAPSGTAGNAITFTQAMTLDASGNLALGTTAAQQTASNRTVFSLAGGTNGALMNFISSSGRMGYVFGSTTDIEIAAEGASVPIRFVTNGSERARIDSSGNFGLGVTPPASTVGMSVRGTAGDAQYRLYNSTSGVTSSDGVMLSIAGTLDGYLWNYENANFIFGTNNTERARIDSSGNFLVGTTSQHYSVAGRGTIEVNGSTESLIGLSQNNSASAYLYSAPTALLLVNAQNTPLTFATNATERARITSGGELLVGTTSSGIGTGRVTSYNTGGATFAAILANTSGSSASQPIVRSYHFESNSTTSAIHYEFTNRSVGVVGTIACTGSATAYNTSSDYRLKNTIAPMTGALAKVALLKPCTYKWNADGSDGEGFIAHELAEVVPQCVTGAKDAVDDDGNPKYQGIDTSFLVATLTAALQEAVAEINSLKARLDAANL